jgi:hypothetical protein
VTLQLRLTGGWCQLTRKVLFISKLFVVSVTHVAHVALVCAVGARQLCG